MLPYCSERAETPSATISQAMDLYLSEIILNELVGKSPKQIATFSKTKRRAVANFIKINGDLNMKEITRDHARAVRKFWQDRIHPTDSRKPMSGSKGNKDLGSLRKLYRKYFEHIGEEERQNPFRNMRFTEQTMEAVKPFDLKWVRERILAPNIFEGLNSEGALLVMVLIETGCHRSEIANILPENIYLDADMRISKSGRHQGVQSPQAIAIAATLHLQLSA